MATRSDLPAEVVRLGGALVGKVADAEFVEGTAGPLTLCHGDTSAANLATSPDGEIAFLDWEDLRCAAGVTDLAWHLISSVDPNQWNDLEALYGQSIDPVLPSVTAQTLFALSDQAEGSAKADAWIVRLRAVAGRIMESF